MRPGTGGHQLQAAINVVHADALTVEQTNWSQIVALYDQLLGGRPHAGGGPQPRHRHR
jgi:RNA polymerase sigma-70 factor, ECF subfamily